MVCDAKRRKHLAEGATLAVSTVEAGEGDGEKTGARPRALGIVCQGLLVNLGSPPSTQQTFRPKRVNENSLWMRLPPLPGRGPERRATLSNTGWGMRGASSTLIRTGA